jgi:hypothetical protein
MQLFQEGLELFQYEDVGDIQVVYPLEALNHCLIKRSRLKEELQTRDLLFIIHISSLLGQHL